MGLLNNFQFSQSNLQDYLSCPRRFELRYISRIKWPAPISESFLEFEKHQKMGEMFHNMINQYCLGVPVNLILPPNSPPLISQWWENFLISFPLNKLPIIRFPEFKISVLEKSNRVIGRFDLLTIDTQGKITIYDWKTSINKVPVSRLVNSVQSRLYPILIVEGGKGLNNGLPFIPDQVEMVYWFPGFPDNSVTITYDTQKYFSDKQLINNLIFEIINLSQNEFTKTAEEKNCRFCNFKSFCEINSSSEDWTSVENYFDESQFSFNINFDQIAEVEY